MSMFSPWLFLRFKTFGIVLKLFLLNNLYDISTLVNNGYSNLVYPSAHLRDFSAFPFLLPLGQIEPNYQNNPDQTSLYKWKCKLRVRHRRLQFRIWCRRKINQNGFASDFRLGHIWNIMISIMLSLKKLVLSYFARGAQNVKGWPPKTSVFMAIRGGKHEICPRLYKSWMFFLWISHNLVELSEMADEIDWLIVERELRAGMAIKIG